MGVSVFSGMVGRAARAVLEFVVGVELCGEAQLELLVLASP